MGLSNTAIPKYYAEFRDKVIRGEIPINEKIEMEMNRIDALIKNPNIFYDEKIVDGWIAFCENELTLTDGSKLHMLLSFKVWGEQVYGWYYFVERSVYVPNESGHGGHYERKRIKKRLTNKQYLIIGRGASKSLYCTCHHAYGLTCDRTTTYQVTTAPTMRQADEVMSPFRTAITRHVGPYFTFLTAGSANNTVGPLTEKPKLEPTKKGIENKLTNSLLEVRPMTIDKLQGLRCKTATIDEWLSGDIKEDVMGALEQGCSKVDDWLIIAVSSEGTVRNGPGDTIKMELDAILRGEYYAPHVSIWWYCLDDIDEVGIPEMWRKANPNLGYTVSYETYQLEVERMEHSPSTRNDTLAKRFGIPAEGYTYFFTYEETIPHKKQEFWGMPCALGADLSQGDDFCAFAFWFPLRNNKYGVKALSFISSRTMMKLKPATRAEYEKFLEEGTLIVLDGTILDMRVVFSEVIKFIDYHRYDVRCFGYDPYNAREFVEMWEQEYGPYGIEKVIQGSKTESVPLGEIKDLTEDRDLIFDEEIMKYTMGNCIVLQDTNGNRKLYKLRYEDKIDNVAAAMDAYIAYKLNKDEFE